jgi:hypothetical protein
MTLVQRFAQVFGAIYLVVGVVGFIPPLLAAKQPDSSFMGCCSACSSSTRCTARRIS